MIKLDDIVKRKEKIKGHVKNADFTGKAFDKSVFYC